MRYSLEPLYRRYVQGQGCLLLKIFDKSIDKYLIKV